MFDFFSALFSKAGPGLAAGAKAGTNAIGGTGPVSLPSLAAGGNGSAQTGLLGGFGPIKLTPDKEKMASAFQAMQQPQQAGPVAMPQQQGFQGQGNSGLLAFLQQMQGGAR